MAADRDEAPGDCGDRGSKGQTKTDAAIVHDAERKAAATAIARAAMAGVPVYELMDGSFLAVWGVARQFSDLDAVEAFLRRVEVAT